MKVRVLLADSEALFTSSEKATLEAGGFEVVAEAHNGWEAVGLARSCQPDVALLGVFLPLLNGLDAAREIRRVLPRCRTALLTTYIDGPYIRRALRLGIEGYLSKSCTPQILINAINAIDRGGVCLCPEAARASMEHPELDFQSDDRLSPKERHALQLIAEGRTTKDIAAILGISVKTAEARRHRITVKIQRKDTASMVLYAVRQAMIAA